MFLLTSLYSSYLFLFVRGYKADFLQSCEVEPNTQSGISSKAQSAGLRKDSKAQSAGPKQNCGQSAKRWPFEGFSIAHGAKAQSAGSKQKGDQSAESAGLSRKGGGAERKALEKSAGRIRAGPWAP